MTEHRISEPVAVTGATGLIGRRLVARLIETGHRPRALVLPDDAVPEPWAGEVEVVRGDVTRRTDVRSALGGAATVFHLAAIVSDWGEQGHHQAVTVGGTENVLREAAQQGARVVLASSIVVYGHQLGRVSCDESLPHGRPHGAYSRSKQAQERLARRFEAERGLEVTTVRPGNVFGPRSAPWVDEAAAHLRAGMPSLIGDGRGNAGMTYVDNVADVLVRAAATPAAVGRVYNAADGLGVSWRRYFSDLAELCGAPAPRPIPRALAYAAAAVLEPAFRALRRQGRPPLTREALSLVGADLQIPIDKAQRELGYQPVVSYREGLERVGRYLETEQRAP